MAIQAILEVQSGSLDAPAMPYYIYDDGDPPASVSLNDALTKALSVAPADVEGAPGTGLTYSQEADHAWQVTVNYSRRKLKNLEPLGVGEERIRFNFTAQSKFLFTAPEIARFPADEAPDYGGMLNIRRGGGGTTVVGATIPLPTENLGKQAIVSLATAASLASTVASLVGYVNSEAVGLYSAGELMLTSFRGQQRDDETFDLSIGWSYIPNVTDETWGDVTGVSYKGHEYTWAYTKDVTDRNGNALYQVPQFVYVNQVWPTGNLNAIGIYPP
ncbi:hypothetical protein EH220_03060 [bacterium]|nr:MAG: hypothetical protein EH220_03060 [bacterium]